MKRLLLSRLIEWKARPGRQPLIIKGVRQCGKTYLLREFGREHYEDVAYFNFESNASLHECFEKDGDVERIITELAVLHKRRIDPARTLIIFDEIQFCNAALNALKYFCEELPQYHIACAGSLLGIALSKPMSFPVGKVEFLHLRPMNFHEFLIAHGEEMLCEYVQKLPHGERVSGAFAGKLMNYLRSFFMVGGMPEAVATWVATKDIAAVEAIQQKILDGYELDFAKYAPAREFPKLSLIWNSIPQQLSKENAKFIFSRVRTGARAKDLEDALQWLLDAGLALKVAKIAKPFMPLSAYADQSHFKLYMADVGLLRKMAKLPAEAMLDSNDSFREFKGALTENYVLCELVCLFGETPYYWKSENIAEVDFVVQMGMDIVPIEVKSGRGNRARSLAEYRKKYKPRVAVKTSMKELSDTAFKNIPLYLLWSRAAFES